MTPSYASILPRKFITKRVDDIIVWIVDGRYVREHLYQDFTQGGHGYVYDFIPINEIWIDDDLSPDERPFVIRHELYERSLMMKGISYDHAHTWANKIEASLRRVKTLTGHKKE